MTPSRARLPGILALCGLALSAAACSAGETKPAAQKAPASAAAARHDLRDFVARREQCDHFRGEEAGTAARQAELDAKLKEFCTGTDAQLAALKKKYRGDKAASRKLAAFDANIE